MSSLNILNDESIKLKFPTVFEYSIAQTYNKHQNERRQYFSNNNVFINNGNTFNGKYIIKYLMNPININDIDDGTFLNKNKSYSDMGSRNIINEIQDEEYDGNNSISNNLDESSNTIKISNSTKNQCSMFSKNNFISLQQQPLKQNNKNNLDFKIMTTVNKSQLNKLAQYHLKNCKIIDKNDIPFTLMRSGIIVFDLSNANDLESEFQQAKSSFNHIYYELNKLSSEEISKLKKNKIVRKFILISTVMAWEKETNSILDENDEEVGMRIMNKHIFERLPRKNYEIIFEFEKLILSSNSSRIKDIFKTFIISTGITYGHEENTFHYIFKNAWNNPEEIYISMINRTVPVFHVDELAKLVLIISKYDRYIKNNYILAVDEESYGINDIIKSVCDKLCSSRLVIKEDYLIKDHYKLNDFNWDLICCDLIIDPMLDIIIPDYQIRQTPMILKMKNLICEFIEENKLCSLKIIVTGYPAKLGKNIVEYLAQYYQVPLLTIHNLVINYLNVLKNKQYKLKLKMNDINEKCTNMSQLLAEMAGKFNVEQLHHVNEIFNNSKFSSNKETNDETIVDNNQFFEMAINDIPTKSSEILNTGNNEYLQENTFHQYLKYKIHLFEMDEEIKNIKFEIENLNYMFEEYENNLNKNDEQTENNYLLPVIKKSLSSFTSKNQGYILELFPLSVEQNKFIFHEDVDYPDMIIVPFCSKDVSKLRKYTSCSSMFGNSKNPSFHTVKHVIETDPTNFLTYYENKANNTINIPNVNYARDTLERESDSKYKIKKQFITKINSMEDYFTNKGVRVLRFSLPLELSDENISSYDLHYKAIADTIITQIRHPSSKENIFEMTKSVKQMTPKTRKITEDKFRTALNKLNIMKKQWNSGILKTLQNYKGK